MDGVSDADEREAGTDPTDPDSRFELVEAKPDTFGGVTVEFHSRPGRDYDIEWSADFSHWILAGSISAEDWPATTTQAHLPASVLAGSVPERAFFRVVTR